MLIASTPGDEEAVSQARRRHPKQFVCAFMLDPSEPGAPARARHAFRNLDLTTMCLFPAMHRIAVDSPACRLVLDEAASAGAAVFVHCGLLSIGVRKKLGLPTAFDLRLGNPLAIAAVAGEYPRVPFVIPHFGAGFLTEALMAASSAGNIYFDTSSSNSWVSFHAGLTLAAVFERFLAVVGSDRLLFGSDSSFFPRGWHRPVYEAQKATLTELGVSLDEQALIFGGNFDRVLVSAT